MYHSESMSHFLHVCPYSDHAAAGDPHRPRGPCGWHTSISTIPHAIRSSHEPDIIGYSNWDFDWQLLTEEPTSTFCSHVYGPNMPNLHIPNRKEAPRLSWKPGYIEFYVMCAAGGNVFPRLKDCSVVYKFLLIAQRVANRWRSYFLRQYFTQKAPCELQ